MGQRERGVEPAPRLLKGIDAQALRLAPAAECLVGARRLAVVMRERLCHFEQALVAAALHFFRDPEV